MQWVLQYTLNPAPWALCHNLAPECVGTVTLYSRRGHRFVAKMVKSALARIFLAKPEAQVPVEVLVTWSSVLGSFKGDET